MKKIKNAKQVDFNNLKFLAFSNGYHELVEFVQNNQITRGNRMIGKVHNKQQAQKIREQANAFGYKVGISTYAFGNPVADSECRTIEIGHYY